MKRQTVTVYIDEKAFKYIVDFTYLMATYEDPEDYDVYAVYDEDMDEIGEDHPHYQDAIDAVDRFGVDEFPDY